MSNIKHKNIKTVTSSGTLTLSDLGVISINSASNTTINIPLADAHMGLWYNFINKNTGTATISDGTQTVTTILGGISKFLVSDGTSWIVTNKYVTASSPLNVNGEYLELNYDDGTLAVENSELKVKSNTFESYGAVSTHENKKITDIGGVHGFEISSTPTISDDGKVVAWSESLQKHTYIIPASVPDVNKTIYIADWDSATTYSMLDACYFNGQFYKSLLNDNLNQAPSTPTSWTPITSSGGSGGFINLEQGEFIASTPNTTTVPIALTYSNTTDFIYVIHNNNYLVKDDDFTISGSDILLSSVVLNEGDNIFYIIAHGGDTYSATNIALDTTNFNNFLDDAIDDVQKLADKIDNDCVNQSDINSSITTHENKKVTDSGGLHGFYASTPTVSDDGYALVWDNVLEKHIYAQFGDMYKSIYDTDNDGKVDASEDSDMLDGKLPSYYASTPMVNNHIDDTIFDNGGVHGFEISSSPNSGDDGKFLAWNESLHKHVYSPTITSVDKTIYIANWSDAVSYSIGNGCYYNKKFYSSLTNSNLNKNPETQTSDWEQITSSSNMGGFTSIEQAEFTASTPNTTTIPITLTYNPSTDYIYLIYNNTYLLKDEEFTVSGENILLNSWSLNTNESIYYIIAHGNEAITATSISLDTTSFNNFLDITITDVQRLANKIDEDYGFIDVANIGYYEPLTNGDPENTELLFYNGDVIMAKLL